MRDSVINVDGVIDYALTNQTAISRSQNNNHPHQFEKGESLYFTRPAQVPAHP
jgi:hypothetical protein